MRIDLNPRIPETPESGQAAQSSARAGSRANQALTTDSAQLSADRARVQALAAQANQLPEVRQEKVAALSQLVRQGNYNANAGQTAEALLSHMSNGAA